MTAEIKAQNKKGVQFVFADELIALSIFDVWMKMCEMREILQKVIH